jgi:sporulation protein YlmC with PRC-barrel domain
MGTTRLLRGAGVLTLVAVLASGALAANPGSAASGQSYSDANAVAPRSSSAMTAPNGETLKRASRVMHAKVKSPDGKTLGRVHDLVLTPDLNGISYVAVSADGFLGIGSTLHAVPWDSLSQGVNDTYSIPVTEQQFKQSKGFNTKYWPSSAEIGWTRQGQEAAYRGEMAADSQSIQNRRFTRIKGADAKGTDGKKIGDIHDLVIVMDTGRIAYDIVAYGGLLGLGQRFTAVPESVVTLELALHVARIEATPATLHANSFTPSQWPDLSSPSYSRPLARAFGVQPSGTALGYVPAEGGAVAAAPSPRTPAKPSARSTTPPVSGAMPSAAAAPTAAELTGTFNSASVTSMEGTVAEEGKFQPTSSAPETLWLRVRTSNGQIVLANLGPRSYISSQDFYIVPGDQIHLRGSEVTAASGKQVFLPTQVTYGSQTLKLRSETGTGLWEGQATTPGASQPGTTSPSSTSSPQSRAGGPGTALGYTPAEEQTTADAAGAGRAASQSLTPFAPSGLIAVGAFDLSNSRTIDGTVTEVGKSQSAGGPDVIWLRVRTSDGRLVNVQVGPRDYVSKQDFIVVTGDRVHLTGWDARATGETGATPVFIVADISQDGHTLALRHRSGEPLWASPSSMSEPSRSTMTPAPAGRTQGTETPSQRTTTSGTAGSSGIATRAAQEPNEPNKPTEPNKP